MRGTEQLIFLEVGVKIGLVATLFHNCRLYE